MKHSKTTDTACAGQDFDVFQAEDGLAEEVEARAIKTEVVALLAKLDMTQVQLAQKLQTSRTVF